MYLTKQQCPSLVIATGVLLLAAAVGVADPIELHPKGAALSFAHQGPFVTTSDGGILAAGESDAMISHDDGKTWTSYPLFSDNKKYLARGERAILKLHDGTVVLAWMNERERHAGGPWGKGGTLESSQWVLPVYVSRSRDDGRTWSEPIKLQDSWCGAIRSMIETKSGRIVLVSQKVIPWRHVTLTYVSDDQGKTWKASKLIDIDGENGGDHSGTMEATVAELADGRVYMLIRTTKGWFWEAFSSDGGLTWQGLTKSQIRSSTCCGTLARLASGRLVLLWNRPTVDDPGNIHSREELSCAFSEDDAKTWSTPVVLSRRQLQSGEKYYMARQSYPYLYEHRPGELWITTMQGNLRMKISEADLVKQTAALAQENRLCIVAFGASGTARRVGVRNVYADLLRAELPQCGVPVRVINQGIPGNNTNDALKRFDTDVMVHHADVVIILFGINDSMVDVWKGATEPRVALDTYRRNLTTMVRRLKDAKTMPILVTPAAMQWTERLKEYYAGPPYHMDSPYDAADPMGLNATLADYVQAMRDVAQQQQITLADQYQQFLAYDAVDGQDLADLLLDGMHPNDKGHRVLADALLPIIRTAVNTPKK